MAGTADAVSQAASTRNTRARLIHSSHASRITHNPLPVSLSPCLRVSLSACPLLVTCLCPDIDKSPRLPSDGQACLQIFSGFAYLPYQKPSITETLTSMDAGFSPFCLPYPKEQFAMRPIARQQQNDYKLRGNSSSF